jgi:glycosyltransferase A (GT-A) superfamily protein (DUF2064 family)
MKNQFSIGTEIKIALMVYGKTPSIQTSQKQLFGSKNRTKSYHIFEQLNQHTQVDSKKSNIGCIWIYHHNITGNTFGTRYTKAFESTFKKGYDLVISIGNDIPGLDENHIQIAASRSPKYQAVLGLTQDGGDYLFTIYGESFDADSFSKLPWNTNQLHNALNIYLTVTDQEIFQLVELTDIDDFKSFSKSGRQTTRGFFHKFFIRILQSIQEYTKSKNLTYNPILIHQDQPLRAPPVFQ